MSTALLERMQGVAPHAEGMAAGREEHRVRWAKLVCLLALGVCFWFSVPYQFPIQIFADPAQAALNEAEAYGGSLARQISVPVMALISVWMLWRLPRRGRFQRGPLLTAGVLYCGWVAASLLWSQTPEVTGKRLVVFAADALMAVTLARCFDVEEMASFGFAATAAVALIAVYVDAVMTGRFAPFDADYRFMGVMTANYMAMNLAVSMICGLTLALKRPAWLRWIAPCVALESGLLVLTRSRVGTVICVLMLSVLVLRLVRERMRAESRALALLLLLAVAVPAVVYAIGSKGAGAAQAALMLGRKDTENNASLSNRAPLWAELWESVERRPLLGVGYAGFWTPQRVEAVSQDQGWAVPNAHDSYLDQVLSVGVVGAVLYLVVVWGSCFVAWRRGLVFEAVMLTWLGLTGLAESAPLDPYLPTLLAYACAVRMMMAAEGGKAEAFPQRARWGEERFAEGNGQRPTRVTVGDVGDER